MNKMELNIIRNIKSSIGDNIIIIPCVNTDFNIVGYTISNCNELYIIVSAIRNIIEYNKNKIKANNLKYYHPIFNNFKIYIKSSNYQLLPIKNSEFDVLTKTWVYKC